MSTNSGTQRTNACDIQTQDILNAHNTDRGKTRRSSDQDK